jgi:hypothetical protein
MANTRGDVRINLQGFPAANRDATVVLKNVNTGLEVKRKPFLDGSAVIRDLEPGLWEVQVEHPNVINPIRPHIGPIRVFPGRTPTVINVPVPAALFKNNPIADVPDADLGPVQATLDNVKSQTEGLGGKQAGEAFLAADWNRLVSAVGDLASAVSELTKLVAPRGHDHPEIATKIDEVQLNIVNFTEAFGKTLVELQRAIEFDKLKADADDVLSQPSIPQKDKDTILSHLNLVKGALQSDPVRFTQQLSALGGMLHTAINTAAVTHAELLDRPSAARIIQRADTYTSFGVQTRPASELQIYRQVRTKTGGE